MHEDFIYDEMRDIFICPACKPLTTTTSAPITRSDISPLCLSVARVAFASMVDQPRFPDDTLS